MEPSRPSSATPNPAGQRTVLAGAIGNVLEWYDFAIYGYFAPIIGTLFFPADDPLASLLAAFGVFAVGYAARPLGGAAFGHIGDKIGRKPALILSVMMMGAATSAIGLLPDHAEIGTTAALLLVALRIAQGLSVGGEYPGSIVFLAEHAPPERRGYLASWPMFGSVGGFLLGSGLGALVSSMLDDAAMHAWGWRIPFLLGALIATGGVVFAGPWTTLESTERRRSPARPSSPRCATTGARSCAWSA